MRTFEELEKDNYENLTYGEMSEYNLDCKCYCPLYGEYCNGGMNCYGGMPVEPPCTSFTNDTVLQQVIDDWYASSKMHELWEEKQEEKLAIKKQKSDERKKKLNEYKYRNYENLIKIKELKKDIKYNERQILNLQKINIFASSVNIVNEMFREGNCSCPNDINNKPLKYKIEIYKQNISNCKNKILVIRNEIKLNEKTLKRGIK